MIFSTLFNQKYLRGLPTQSSVFPNQKRQQKCSQHIYNMIIKVLKKRENNL